MLDDAQVFANFKLPVLHARRCRKLLRMQWAGACKGAPCRRCGTGHVEAERLCSLCKRATWVMPHVRVMCGSRFEYAFLVIANRCL